MVLKELGLESRALGFVAGFTGAAIEKGVQAKGIATDFVHLQEGFSRINVKIKSEEETELNGRDLPSGQKQLRNCSGNWTSCGTGTPLCWLAAFPVRCRQTPMKRFWHI